mgnify:CR=1 FL=1
MIMIRGSHKLLLFILLMMSVTSCLDKTVPIYVVPSEGRLLLGATLHMGDGEVIKNAAVGVKDGYVTLLADAAVDKLDLERFQVERLGPDYHIYPFRKTKLGNSGIVLARATGGSINISIRDQELEKCVSVGCEAMLLICRGSIKDYDRFKVDYVFLGEEKVKVLSQSDYAVSVIPN